MYKFNNMCESIFNNSHLCEDSMYSSSFPELELPFDLSNFYLNHEYYSDLNNLDFSNLTSIKVKLTPKINYYEVTKDLLELPQAIACKRLSLNTSSFSKAFNRAISRISKLSHLNVKGLKKKKNLWPYRTRYENEIIKYVNETNEPIVVTIRKYSKSR